MFKNIMAMSREDAEQYASEKHTEKSAVISIKSRFDGSKPRVHETDDNGIVAVLFMSFNDANTLVEGGMTIEESAEIAQFIHMVATDDNYKDVETLIVHCDAGYSRSAGVAAAAAKYYLGDDTWFYKHKEPNSMCYSFVLEELISRYGVPEYL